MIAVLLSPIYVLLNAYLIYRAILWLKTFHSVFGKPGFIIPFVLAFVLLALSPLAATFGVDSWKPYARLVSNHWLGSLFYLIGTLLLFDLGHLIRCLITHQKIRSLSVTSHRICGCIVFFGVLLLSLYGLIHADQVKKTVYETTIQKAGSTKNLKIALVADLHLGTNVGMHQMKQMQELIQEMEPDLIAYAGDIFDNDFDAIWEPEQVKEVFTQLSAAYPSYACWGNHDIEEPILAGFTFSKQDETITSDPRMDAFLEEAGIVLLKDEAVLTEEGCYIIGRLDASSNKKSGIVRKTPQELVEGLDQTKPLIVIDHQPAELHELAEAGADLVLSGHTHDGQCFPGNLLDRLLWENSCGMIHIDQMTDVVTSGLGVWGPAMRIGTDSEVVEVNVAFQ